MENTVCPKCKRKFHACSSCGFLYNWEFIYCSQKCAEEDGWDMEEDEEGGEDEDKRIS